MNVIYKCHCMTLEQTIIVPDRRAEGDLMLWMEMVTHCIAMDHNALKPLCLSNTMEYAKIPMDETTGLIGVKGTTQ